MQKELETKEFSRENTNWIWGQKGAQQDGGSVRSGLLETWMCQEMTDWGQMCKEEELGIQTWDQKAFGDVLRRDKP